ncbi:hypothetical protein BZA05DRAFT_388308 [Tricharina praecox]|uniref:uncharacterized protein n=1 Tax=Tricharina praecox TaxID=43433 RepID=UPI00221E5D7E|nr:uncharacterized protein BZA05DRAFT_388308 [Tricharina praecox]KAI5856378.1 hypothetical protein BZA05DRAFT_388308 [Tricharina praecox]
MILLLEETSYDRVNRFNNPLHPGAYFENKLFTLSGRMGYEAGGWRKFSQTVLDIWLVSRQPQFLLLFIYHGMTYMWTVGRNGTLISYLVPPVSKGGYGFDTVGLGLIYFAPIVAMILGELFGHFFNDALQNRFSSPRYQLCNQESNRIETPTRQPGIKLSSSHLLISSSSHSFLSDLIQIPFIIVLIHFLSFSFSTSCFFEVVTCHHGTSLHCPTAVAITHHPVVPLWAQQHCYASPLQPVARLGVDLH